MHIVQQSQAVHPYGLHMHTDVPLLWHLPWLTVLYHLRFACAQAG
jgi:hypothetical protein